MAQEPLQRFLNATKIPAYANGMGRAGQDGRAPTLALETPYPARDVDASPRSAPEYREMLDENPAFDPVTRMRIVAQVRPMQRWRKPARAHAPTRSSRSRRSSTSRGSRSVAASPRISAS